MAVGEVDVIPVARLDLGTYRQPDEDEGHVGLGGDTLRLAEQRVV